jgi:hypothetical protein
METMWLSLTQSSYASYTVSKKSVTLEGAETLVTRASAFVLLHDKLFPTLESLKIL